MQITKQGNSVYITLSRRNVAHLLHAEETGCAEGLKRRTEDGTSLYIRVESDADHYKDREAGPGLEAFIKRSS